MAGQLGKHIDKAIAVAKARRDELLKLSNVVAVSAGGRRRKGKPVDEAVVVVMVRKKLSASALRKRGIDILPKQLDGIGVDVREYGADPETAEVRTAFEGARKAKEKVEKQWLKQPNVTGIGVGYKETKGRRTDKVAICIFVEKKLSKAQLKKAKLKEVPRTIEGVATDVRVMGRVRTTSSPSGSRGDRQDPLLGGLSIGHASAPFHFGTLAAIAFDSSNNPLALSNEHVLDGDIGETVQQPSPVGLDDSFEVGLQLDVCNPLHFLRVDTPDTTGGTILAGAALAAATAAALSDEIDPTRLGQTKTIPGAGAVTFEEYAKVKVDYPVMPLPGTPFPVNARWHYERRTDQGNLNHAENVARKYEHVLRYHRLFTDRRKYLPDETIRLFGVVLLPPDQKKRCKDFYCVALLRPGARDKSYPVVLRSVQELENGKILLGRFVEEVLHGEQLEDGERELLLKNQREMCLYYGERSANDLELGAWRHWMHVQTVNTVPVGTNPLQAAQVIGGLPASNPYRTTLDIACGPFVFEDDGSFDIELI